MSKTSLKDSLGAEVWTYIVIAFGILIYTLAYASLLLPSKIISGGVTGISSIIYFLSGEKIPVGVSNFFINAILFVLGLKFLGPKFGAKTVFGFVLTSLLFILWQQVLHVENLFDVEQFGPFMCTIIGGAVCGIGLGLAFGVGGNTGGTDIIALIFSKYYNVTPGKVLMFCDLIIIACTYFVSHSIDKMVFGYIVMVVCSYCVDLTLDGSKQSYQMMIFSNKWEAINEAIISEVGRGVTIVDAQGGYTKTPQKVLIVICHKVDKPIIMHIVNKIDPSAFMSVSKAQGVYGTNFEQIKK